MATSLAARQLTISEHLKFKSLSGFRDELIDGKIIVSPDATAVGLLLARTGTSDMVDAHVAICAKRAGQAVLTSDPDDLRRIAPELLLVAV